MATYNAKTLGSGVKKVSFNHTTGSGTCEISNAFGTSRIGSWRLQVVPGGASPGSLVLKTRLTGSELSGSNWLTPIYYSDATTTTANAGGPITTVGIFTVICDRCDLLLDWTDGADGMDVYLAPVMG